VAEFGAPQQLAYRRALAAVASVDLAAVRIANIRAKAQAWRRLSAAGRRRLAGAGVTFDVTINVASGTVAGTIKNTINEVSFDTTFARSFSSELASANLPVPPTLSTEHSSVVSELVPAEDNAMGVTVTTAAPGKTIAGVSLKSAAGAAAALLLAAAVIVYRRRQAASRTASNAANADKSGVQPPQQGGWEPTGSGKFGQENPLNQGSSTWQRRMQGRSIFKGRGTSDRNSHGRQGASVGNPIMQGGTAMSAIMRLAALEGAAFGSTNSGGVLERLEALEESVMSSPSAQGSSISDRLAALERALGLKSPGGISQSSALTSTGRFGTQSMRSAAAI
jgi:hypothetical protein